MSDASRNPSATVDPDYAWAVGDHWLIDRDGDDLECGSLEEPHLRGGAEAELALEDA